jgi:DNA invertase Pin-like site-specific DNA recombinase
MTVYGYARQHHRSNARRARGHLARSGRSVFKEKISGAASNRAQLHRLLKTIDAGDAVLVTRLDRLARSTRDLLNVLDKITKAGATFRSLGDAWADTATAHGRLMLTVLGGLAEFERELIRVRTGEGRVRAKARGVHMGRPFKLNDISNAKRLRDERRGKRSRISPGPLECITLRSADCGPNAQIA